MLRRLLALFAIALAPATCEADADYERDIKPLFAKKCGACHSALAQEAELRLDAGSLIHEGGESGQVIVPGEAASSLLIERITAEDAADRMPPEGEGEPLTPEQVELVRSWIDGGAAFPDDEAIPADPREHWAYQVPIRPSVPEIDNADWSTNPIDAFLAAKQREANITPVGLADRRTLLRRVYLDLIGLPPSRDEQQAFLADESEDAWERTVERLLASPEHAERWARHWMDVWRYSDWDGYRQEVRGSHKHIWRWREWIIDSLLADKPYDRMILEMLAADELSPGDEDAVRATGFLVRNFHVYNRDLWLDNTVEHTSKAFLAMTMNCSKCHAHKYDPLPQTDYYTMRAIFEPYKVRIDRLPGQPDVEQDGLVRAYDADLETPTYVYRRGNEKHPDKENPIPPALPAVFADELPVEAVPLPVEAWYPDLTEERARQILASATGRITQAEEALAKAETEHEQAGLQLAQLEVASEADEGSPDSTIGGPFALEDDFDTERPELWQMVGGEWEYTDGRLRQSEVSQTKSELIAQVDQPRDFRAEFHFRTLGGSTYHSVGLSFDRTDSGDSDGVYLSAHGPGPKVQIVHNRGGKASYPSTGAKSLPIELNRDYRLVVTVKDQLINVSVDDVLILAYRLPDERREGRFSLWAFDAKAEFIAARLASLPEDALLAESVDDSQPMTVEQARQLVAEGELRVALSRQELSTERAGLHSLEARRAADQAQYTDPPAADAEDLALAAASAQRVHQHEQAQLAVVEARLNLLVEQHKHADAEAAEEALQPLQTKLTEAEQNLEQAAAALDEDNADYSPFSTQYPQSSTGRRLALARWIASPENPLTARVAVNHIWLRHFGTPLVENVFDFGLRSPAPLHHELLDWLAVELMENNWSMRHLHRLIVTSRAYRLASSAAKADGVEAVGIDSANEIDPDNAYYWRANVRRLDAEAVRDSVLAVAGSLDRSRGGPDIDYAEGESVLRRSLYFRHAYEKQMRFLVLFDAASPNECYRRSESIVPQQALALVNSTLSICQSRVLARSLTEEVGAGQDGDDAFLTAAFEQILCRQPSAEERAACSEFLQSQSARLTAPDSLTTVANGAAVPVAASEEPAQRARENLVHVLMNHNDFVTVR